MSQNTSYRIIDILKPNSILSQRIECIHWIIIAISKHVIAQNILSSRNQRISVEEAAEGGVVVSALQIVKLSFVVIDIAAVADGVMGAAGSRITTSIFSVSSAPAKTIRGRMWSSALLLSP